jgi:NADH dehydrogenase [ubiquinone] 1 alpha subcomplex assembly factor 7
VSALKEKIVRLIRAQGPINVAQYMQHALGDPFHGYYISRDPFGRDFTTAPEVSQIFGELLGLFFVQAWEDRGRPQSFYLAELGPGRGTLMADMMRAAEKVRPEFARAAKLILMETSPLLRSIQKKALQRHTPDWVVRWEELPGDAPLYLVANEFFDALPIHQFVHAEDGWHERVVIAQGEELEFALNPDAQAIELPFDGTNAAAKNGARNDLVVEINPEAQAIMAGIAERIADLNGVGLIIDYGYSEPGYGDTLQAVRSNRYADPLSAPGETDLTAHVDFTVLKTTAEQEGARTSGPITQKQLLEGLGIHLRASRLKSAAPASAKEIDEATARLTDETQMGSLFKAMALSRSDSKQLPGFPC